MRIFKPNFDHMVKQRVYTRIPYTPTHTQANGVEREVAGPLVSARVVENVTGQGSGFRNCWTVRSKVFF